MSWVKVMAVFKKTTGLSDKTAKFRKCPANLVSLPDSMSDSPTKNYNPENALTVFRVTSSSMDENCTYFLCILTIFHQICSVYSICKTSI